MTNATATNLDGANDDVRDGDRIQVTADVGDDDLDTVDAIAREFGVSEDVDMFDNDSDGTYVANFTVDTSSSSIASDGDTVAVNVTALDTAGNRTSVLTNGLTLNYSSGTATSAVRLTDHNGTADDAPITRPTAKRTAVAIANADTGEIEEITFENRFSEFWASNTLGPFDTIYEWNGKRIGELTNEIPRGAYQFEVENPSPDLVRRSGGSGAGTNYFTIVTRGMNPGHYAQNTETTVNFFLESKTMHVVGRNETHADRRFSERVSERSEERLPDAGIPRREIVVSNTTPASGDTVTISATVHNFGREYISKAFVRFLVNGTEVSEQPVYFMEPGSTRTREVDYTVSASDPRELNVTVVVDPEGNVTEEDTTNNGGTVVLSKPGATAAFETTPSAPTVSRPAQLDASGSTAADGNIVSYEWDLDGDGDVDANGSSLSHRFTAAGDQPVTLIVTDDAGTTARTTRTIPVLLPPEATAFEDTTTPSSDRITPPGLADRLRVESDAVTNTSVERTANDSGVYALSIDVTGDATNVTFYLNASEVSAALGGLEDAQLLVDGEGESFWTERADGQRWVAFVIEEFSTRQVAFATDPAAPTAAVTAAPATPNVGESITLDASDSSDPNGDALRYAWDLDGDGNYDDGSGETVTASFDSAGEAVVGVRVTDTTGLTNATERTLSINAVPDADFSVSPETPTVGESVTLDASGSTDSDGAIDTYEWDLDGDGSYDDATGMTVTTEFGSSGDITVGLRVADADGAVDTTEVTVTVNAPSPTPTQTPAETPTETPTPTETSTGGQPGFAFLATGVA
ncbi:PKD domain-containing protein, partial [Haloplanus sp.]|uniref:PKD domain-containing protein n=1 Tax=Haloplanus sp. TaxID=1961696 RepID=UPI00261B5DD2